ncbi:MAG: choice-of-anchor X domain-containing protein [Phycisphaerales bacterium]
MTYRNVLGYATAITATTLLAGLAGGMVDFPEAAEPNNAKTQATLVTSMANGDTLSGVTTGTSTSTTVTATSVDTFRVGTAAAPLGIYRHRLSLSTTGTVGHTGTIRGISQAASVAQPTTDVVFQTSSTIGNGGLPIRANQWYGFGRQEEIYYRVQGSASTTGSYLGTLESVSVTPNTLSSTVAAGSVTFARGAGVTTNVDFWLYDSNFDPIPMGGADTGDTLTRTLTTGTYYIAWSNTNTSNTQVAIAGDAQNNILDFANAVANSSTTLLNTATNNNNISVSSLSGTATGAANKADGFEVTWYTFTVVAPPDYGVTGAFSPTSVLNDQARTSLYTATVLPGGQPTVTGLMVTSDMSALGLGVVTMLDDGMNGDVTADDGIYSYQVNTTTAQAAFVGTFPISVSDGMGHSASGTSGTFTITESSGACCNMGGCSISGINACLTAGGMFLGNATLCQTPSGYVAAVGNNAFEDISATGTVITTGDDALSATQTVAFPFTFYGAGVTGFKASTNGYITFDTAATLTTYYGGGAINGAALPNNAIYVLADDLNGTNQVRTETRGTAGVDLRQIVQWTNSPQFGGAGNNTFQVILAENGTFELRYSSIDATITTADDSIIGCENAAGTANTQLNEATIVAGNSVGFTFQNAQNNCPSPPTGTGAASPTAVLNDVGGAVNFSVSVVPGAVPASTNIAVTLDLSSIGGSAMTAMFDDGMHGDGIAGDNVFGVSHTVAALSPLFAGPIVASISDGEMRSSSANIVFAVNPANGACCNMGNCTFIDPVACAASGGSWLGRDFPCNAAGTYSGASGAMGTYEDISLTGTLVAGSTAGDDTNFPITLPFPFEFNGTSRTTAGVCSNGFLQFTGVSTVFTNGNIPSAAAPNDAIYPCWDDFNLNVNNNDGIFTQHMDAGGPNERFIVQWHNIAQFGAAIDTESNNFQVVLFPSGSFSIRYGSMVATVFAADDSTVGFENAAGTVAQQFDESTLAGGASVNYTFTPGQSNCQTSNPTGVAATTPGTVHNGGGQMATVAVTVTPGLIPASTGIAVSLDASALAGGSINLLDDGNAPDAMAGDNIFSGTVTVNMAQAAGTINLPFTVSDAQMRMSMGSATLMVRDAVGACCVTGGCSIVAIGACTSGTFLGDGTVCAPEGSYVIVNGTGAFEDISTDPMAARILATPTTNAGDDTVFGPIPMGLSFSLYGGAGVTNCGICTNGNIQFNLGAVDTEFLNENIPVAFSPNSALYPAWDDFNFNDDPAVAGSSGIYFMTRGTPGMDLRFIVQWDKARQFGTTNNTNTFQAVIFEDGSVEYRYSMLDADMLTLDDTTIGVENAAGTTATQYDETLLTVPGALLLGYSPGATNCPSTCTVDFNDDGFVEPGDLDEFITFFFSDIEEERALCDFNGDGFVEPGDLDEFITAFFEGCP